jgi:hypothetical protein
VEAVTGSREKLIVAYGESSGTHYRRPLLLAVRSWYLLPVIFREPAGEDPYY